MTQDDATAIKGNIDDLIEYDFTNLPLNVLFQMQSFYEKMFVEICYYRFDEEAADDIEKYIAPLKDLFWRSKTRLENAARQAKPANQCDADYRAIILANLAAEDFNPGKMVRELSEALAFAPAR